MNTHSATRSSYINQPPDFPEFMFKVYANPIIAMIEWAKKEHRDRMVYCSRHGYYRELKMLNEEYSPIRILAEVHKFRKYCSMLTDSVWRKLTKSQRDFIIESYELREMLFKDMA